MIEDTLQTIKNLEKKGLDKKEALLILLIQELKEIKEVLKNDNRS